MSGLLASSSSSAATSSSSAAPTTSTTTTAAAATARGNLEKKRPRRPSDLYLPIAIIGRLMKEPLPNEMKVTKRAKLCVQECATEFVMFLMSEAADICSESDRHRVTGHDVVEAMRRLGLDDYHDVIAPFLEVLTQSNKSTKASRETKHTKVAATIVAMGGGEAAALASAAGRRKKAERSSSSSSRRRGSGGRGSAAKARATVAEPAAPPAAAPSER